MHGLTSNGLPIKKKCKDMCRKYSRICPHWTSLRNKEVRLPLLNDQQCLFVIFDLKSHIEVYYINANEQESALQIYTKLQELQGGQIVSLLA